MNTNKHKPEQGSYATGKCFKRGKRIVHAIKGCECKIDGVKFWDTPLGKKLQIIDGKKRIKINTERQNKISKNKAKVLANSLKEKVNDKNL